MFDVHLWFVKEIYIPLAVGVFMNIDWTHESCPDFVWHFNLTIMYNIILFTVFVHSLLRAFSLNFNFMQVLPSLREKHDEFMLRELVQRWSNHKVMVRWLSRFFHYLDRYFISRRSLTPLKEVGLTCFRELVKQKLLICRFFFTYAFSTLML